MKKITALLAACLLCLVLPFTVLADSQASKLTDNAGLLSASEAEEVTAALEQVSNKYNVDIAVMTTYGTNGIDIMTFSDQFFLDHGLGTGTDRSGVLLTLDMEGRQWHISTHGEGILAFTDYGIEQCGERIRSYLSSGAYADGFKEYANVADEYFEQERAGTPVDNYGGAAERKAPGTGTYILAVVVSLLAGFGISFAITGSMKRKLKSVVRQTSANAYADQGGLKLRENTDRYMYHHVVAVPLPRNNSSGGSSTHMTGGSTFGGGGGSF